jgi:hypothetical protein
MICLIPRPLLPGEKGSNKRLIRVLAPLPWERGWGEADEKRGVGVRQIEKEGLG